MSMRLPFAFLILIFTAVSLPAFSARDDATLTSIESQSIGIGEEPRLSFNTSIINGDQVLSGTTDAGLDSMMESVPPISVSAASIELTMTVRKMQEGDECGHTCGTETSIDIVAGDEVEICYNVTNTGDVALTSHDLTDSVLGGILNDFPYTLMPGASAFLTLCDSPTETTVFTGEWAASLTLGGDTVSAFDSVTVNVLPEPGISWLLH